MLFLDQNLDMKVVWVFFANVDTKVVNFQQKKKRNKIMENTLEGEVKILIALI